VYLGQLDGRVVAFDQQTGRPLWNARLASGGAIRGIFRVT